jgi:hypothetical protein
MGFRVDGCGTYSGSKKLKTLGNYYCDSCKSVHSFSLYELTEKVTVLYIPVAKLSTRCAILCDRCERGYKVTDEQKFQLLAGNTAVLSRFFAATEEEKAPAPPPPAQKQETLPAPKPVQSALPNRSGCCPRCGMPIDKSAAFCSKCGRRYSPAELGAESQKEADAPRVCSQCGGPVPDGMLFCTHCGQRLG